MIKRYLFGEPIIDTEGVLNKPSPCMEAIPYFSLESTEAGLCLECPLGKSAPVYGLGQNVRGINKRGFRYVHFTGSNAQHGRYVYLPEDMVAIRLSSPEEREYIPMEKGHHYISAELNQMVFFLRKDKMITLGEPAENTDHMNFSNIEVLCNVETDSCYSFYDDDGFTKDYDNPNHYTNICVVRGADNELSLRTSNSEVNIKVTDVTSKNK